MREERERYFRSDDEPETEGRTDAAEQAEAGDPDAEELFAKLLCAAVGQLEIIARSYPDRGRDPRPPGRPAGPAQEGRRPAGRIDGTGGGQRRCGRRRARERGGNAGRGDCAKRKAAKPQRTPR